MLGYPLREGGLTSTILAQMVTNHAAYVHVSTYTASEIVHINFMKIISHIVKTFLLSYLP
jgi:hypothetical protein